MKLSRWCVLATGIFYSIVSAAASSIDTTGSPDGVAISGYDPVSFFTEKKATKGLPELAYEWMGAKWLFATQANLDQFRTSPERYAPQYGGYCAYGMSEGYVSRKPTSGDFELYEGKLYLFPNGASRNAWLQQYRGGPGQRVWTGDRNWQRFKVSLEAAVSPALAQTAPSGFPADATPLTAAAMQERFSGKVYSMKVRDGATWRWEFRPDGYFYFNSGSFSDAGKWSVQESKLCSEGKRINASCNEIRQQGTMLYFKRDNGDIVEMSVQ